MDYSPDIAARMEKTHAYLSEQISEKAIAQATLAHLILDEILAFIQPGKMESDVKSYALSRFEHHGIERIWHPPYVRFGEHTLLTFMDKAKEDRILSEEDIAFVDIGIVKDGMEGDAGKTIASGDHPVFQHLARASESIFKDAVAFWKRENPTGIALYQFIHRAAKELNVTFNLDPAGHLIGAFPHKGWKRGINNFPEHIEAGKWILEIQIRHPEQPYGAFYEDLLY